MIVLDYMVKKQLTTRFFNEILVLLPSSKHVSFALKTSSDCVVR